jgi:hypothetical protein
MSYVCSALGRFDASVVVAFGLGDAARIDDTESVPFAGAAGACAVVATCVAGSESTGLGLAPDGPVVATVRERVVT